MADQRSLRIFVSAVSRELESFRVAISKTLLKLDLHPITQDYFAPDCRSVRELLREKIEGCDAVICLLGQVYGFEPQSFEPDEARRSYTQLEYDFAIELGKPVFVFKAAEDCPVDKSPDQSAELRALQLEHVRQLTSTDHIWTEFRSVEDLVEKVGVIRLQFESRENVAVVSKGLRSFDNSDRNFFLQLLPGPYDENGLPQTIRFWKHRIETTDEMSFKVGVIYGPSGCGKSSLVKAGLLPRLSRKVVSIYVEADSGDTETRLLKQIKRRFPTLPADLDLKGTIEAFRDGQYLGTKQKVLLVLDQFEQWLHARANTQATELTQALQHCDGDHVQCIVMVRDDFWTALTRFLRNLNLPLRDEENAAMVDLFDLHHARNVLEKFGRAFGCLPQDPNPLSAQQQSFLDQAIEGLAQDCRVISIRLALSAEMLKGRPWTPAALKEVGGMKGLGVTFLEQTFGVGAANKKHREHQRGAISILRALLPEPGTEIKGQMRSLCQLREASGYLNRPQEFDELIHILDSELRLITPTGRDSADEVSSNHANGNLADAADEGGYYQLTHDYLVQALREWLPRKQQETRRGRAGLLLASRVSHWKTQRENRFLPSAREYLVIRILTNPRDWTDEQKRMMRRARRVHLMHVSILAVGLAIGGVAALLVANDRNALHANHKIEKLLTAEITEVPKAIEELEDYRSWSNPMLRAVFQQGKYEQRKAATPNESTESYLMRVKLRAALALLPTHSDQLDKDQFNFLFERLLDCDTKTFPIIRDQLSGHRRQLQDRLWDVLYDQNAKAEKRFQAALALAAYSQTEEDRTEPRWKPQAAFVAESIVDASARNIQEFDLLVEALKSLKSQLIDPLAKIFRDPQRTESRLVTANILARYATDAPETLAELLVEAEPRSFDVMFDVLKSDSNAANLMILQLNPSNPSGPAKLSDDVRAARRANAAVALLRLGQQDRVWQHLAFKPDDPHPDPLLRSQIIHRASLYGVPADPFIKQFDEERDVTIRRALILALGEFDSTMLSSSEQRTLVDKLLTLYREDDDPGIHGAAEWLLCKWNREHQKSDLKGRLNQADQELRNAGPRDDRRWYVNKVGQTMVVLQPRKFTMGSPKSEPDREDNENQHDVDIGHSFAIAAREVTNGDFGRFPRNAAWKKQLEEWKGRLSAEQCDDPFHPAVGVSWYAAAEYCNWLSKQHGLSDDELCYKANSKGEFAEGMRPYDNCMSRKGYRLPTEAEWEFACRAGTITSRYFGQSDDLLPDYAWFNMNSSDSTQPVGMKKPNDFGLFDTLGNVLEWCHDGITAAGEVLPEDAEVTNSSLRVLRGAMYKNLSKHVRAARRLDSRTTRQPDSRDFVIGFRPVQTISAR